MSKIIIGLVGPLASGKDVSKKYIEKKYGASSYKFSTVLRDILTRLYLPIKRDNLQDLSLDLRTRFGSDILAKVITEDAKNDKGEIVIIDGVRRMDDIIHLSGLPEFKLISIDTDINLRYERMKLRNENVGDENKLFNDFLADCNKEAEQEIPIVMAKAHFNLNNNGSLSELYTQLDKILMEIKNKIMENYSGKFIVVDGTDGSGKTTQLNLLKIKLESEGYAVEVADFPQYNTKSSGLVEEYLSGKYGQANEVDPYKASIFYAVDRFDASDRIKKWLQAGKIVLANRYTSASLGHQGCKIDNPLERKVFFNWLYDLEYKIFEIPKPDLTIILQVEPEISFTLAQERAREDWTGKTNDIHENNFSHLKAAEQTYLEIANTLTGFRLIKCTHNGQILSRESIHFLVWLTVSQIITHQAKTKLDFEQIGSLIGANQQILKNRDLIFSNTPTNSISQPVPSIPPAPAPIYSPAPSAPAPIITPQTETTPPLIPAHIPISQIETVLKLKVEKISTEAKIPQKAHPSDAGYDLYASDYYSITAYGQALVSTGIKIIIPPGYAGLIWDKSGLANEGITTMGGVIDSNYRGEIKVVVKNLSEDIFNIVPGQKIAQILIQKIASSKLEEGPIEDKTDRHDAGFGSSGKF